MSVRFGLERVMQGPDRAAEFSDPSALLANRFGAYLTIPRGRETPYQNSQSGELSESSSTGGRSRGAAGRRVRLDSCPVEETVPSTLRSGERDQQVPPLTSYPELRRGPSGKAVLALLYLTSFKDSFGTAAWKSHDWDALNRLHEKGYIGNPVSKAKSVALTAEGKAKAEELFRKLFGK